MDLAATSGLLRLLADPTRLRLLALIEREELTVAELAGVLRLAQPRVSTHLAKLKEAGLVRDRRAGVSAYYRWNAEADGKTAQLVQALRASLDDTLIADDLRRLPSMLAQRARAAGWADSVAGDMERHYSPGRTWEALARALTSLIDVGDVLDVASGDGVLAELLAPHARSIVCIDASERVVAAARTRLKSFRNVQVRLGEEDSKSGIDPQDLVAELERWNAARDWRGLRLTGLMTLPPPHISRPFFAQIRQLRDPLQALNLPIFDRYELSMGMSDDFEAAIAEGSNWIRIGRALFGTR